MQINCLFKITLVSALLVVFSFVSFGQTNFKNTLHWNENFGSPKATLENVGWVSGHWTGEAFGGIVEEVWTPPMGNSMMCVFKLVVKGEVQFYEICTISEENETLILRLKHFYADLKGWEEKDETHDFKLVKITEDKAYFDGFTFEKVSDNEITLYVRISEDGKTEEMAFRYKRM